MAHVHPGAYPFGAAAGSGGGGGGAVDSVFGRTGDVAAADGDYDSYYVSKGTPQTIAARHTFNPGSALSPFILHANAQGQLVTGLNADLLDGLDSAAFATAAHVHSAADVTSGLLALARGGTHTDLSATGGAKRVLMQESAGADITVRILAAADIPDLSATYQPLDADLTSWASVARASGFDTFVATPSSANLRSLLTDETGTGAAVFATSPSLVTPLLGTPTSGTLTNCTGLPQAGTVGLTTADSPQFAGVNLGHASDTTIARSAAGKIAVEAKAVPLMSGAFDLVLAGPSAARTWTGPDADATLVSQGGALGTPASGTLTNCTGLPGSGLASGVRPVSTYLGYKTGLADGEYCGDTLEGTAGAALAFGQLCYLAAADSRWELADADAASTAGDVLLGICVLAAASDGSATRMLLKGTIRANSQFPTMTIGGPVYVGTTAGEVQTAQPSGTDDVIRRVGWGLTGDEMLFFPSNDYITHV